jgi:voltage-gated potassium channel
MTRYPDYLLADGKHHAGSAPWQQWLFVIIFKTQTASGKLFDVLLIVAILGSVLTLMLSTVHQFNFRYSTWFYYLEWGFTLLFTLEYMLRLACVKSQRIYARSFYGIVDLLAILPSYLELIVHGGSYLLIIRIIRILRVFRILKLVRYVGEADALMEALVASRRKIMVFIYAVFILVVVCGSIMYLVEGEEHGFTSIPASVYWAIVTLTTVGYGDISPQTPLGQAIASLVMIMGYGIIAVPTGIFAAELGQVMGQKRPQNKMCPQCAITGHDNDAIYCRVCGSNLKPGEKQ